MTIIRCKNKASYPYSTLIIFKTETNHPLSQMEKIFLYKVTIFSTYKLPSPQFASNQVLKFYHIIG